MEKFESKIVITLVGHIFRSFVLFCILYIGLKFIAKIHSSSIPIGFYILFTSFYILFTYIYIGCTNHDFLVFDNRIEIINRVPLFKKKTIIYFNEIRLALFRHEWTESLREKIKPKSLGFIITEYVLYPFFPFEYKWIAFDTDKRKRFHCFGLEFDYYDNKGPIIEGLFHILAEKNINVEWTNTSLNYYAGMMKTVKDKRKANS